MNIPLRVRFYVTYHKTVPLKYSVQWILLNLESCVGMIANSLTKNCSSFPTPIEYVASL